MFAKNCMFFFNEWKTRESRSKRLEKCWCKGAHFYPFCYYYFSSQRFFFFSRFVRPSHFDNRFVFVFFLYIFMLLFSHFFWHSAKHFIFMFAGCLVIERHHLNIYLVFACIVNRCALFFPFFLSSACNANLDFPLFASFRSFFWVYSSMGRIHIWISKYTNDETEWNTTKKKTKIGRIKERKRILKTCTCI